MSQHFGSVFGRLVQSRNSKIADHAYCIFSLEESIVLNLAGWKKVVLGLIATVVLGAVGSGVWDLLGKSASQWVGRAILNIATLGSSAIVNSVYREAAKGLHEASALEQYALFMLCILSVGAFFSVYLSSRARGPRTAKQGAKNFLDEIEPLQDDEKVKVLEKRLASLELKLRKIRVVMFATLLVFAATLGFNYVRLAQANDTATFFRQSVAICAPYVDDQEIKLLNSHFAAIDSKSDFLQVYGELTKIAAANHLRLPDFTPL